MQIPLRYGKIGLIANLPDENVARVLGLNDCPTLPNPHDALQAALAKPAGTEPLRELACSAKNACIVISDLTRPVPNDLILPAILDELAVGGIPAKQVTVLIATGLHRENTPVEYIQMGLAEAIKRGAKIENHQARDEASHVICGTTSLGIEARVDRRYVEADLKILTGLVEPHLMAGYSGGRKAICPGICDASTVMQWHSPQMLEPATACAGNLRGNAVHQQALEVARLAGGADFIVNVTLNEQRQVTGIFTGDLELAHRQAMVQAERQCKVVVDEPVDIVVTTAAGWPLDLTFYQGVKGMIGALPIVKPGGTIIIAQENSEGIGGPEYTEMMLGINEPHDFMQRALCEKTCAIDLWQFHEQEKVLRCCEVLNYSTGLDFETQKKLFVTPLESIEQGISLAIEKHGKTAKIVVIPEGPYVLCCLREDLVGRHTVEQMMDS